MNNIAQYKIRFFYLFHKLSKVIFFFMYEPAKVIPSLPVGLENMPRIQVMVTIMVTHTIVAY